MKFGSIYYLVWTKKSYLDLWTNLKESLDILKVPYVLPGADLENFGGGAMQF